MIFQDGNLPVNPKNFILKLIDFGAARTALSRSSMNLLNAPVMNRYAVMSFEHCAPEQTDIKTKGDVVFIEVNMALYLLVGRSIFI
jgi:serine/threonine protein kinase